MVTINGVKFACERCIRGHRVSGCTHVDSPLRQVKRKGRPPSKDSSVHKQRSRNNSSNLRRSSVLRSCEDLTQLRSDRIDFSLITNLSPERILELRADPEVEIHLPGGTLLGPSINSPSLPRKSGDRNPKTLDSSAPTNVSQCSASVLSPPTASLVPELPLAPEIPPSGQQVKVEPISIENLNAQHSTSPRPSVQPNVTSLHAELHPELHPELHRIPPTDILKDISPRMNIAHRPIPEFLMLPQVYPDRRSTYSPLTQQARSDANVSFFRHIDGGPDIKEENDELGNDEDDLLSSDHVRYKKNAMYSFLPSTDSSPVDSRFNIPIHHPPYTPTSQVDAGIKFELASDIAVEPNELANSLIDYEPQSVKPITPPDTAVADTDPFSSTQIKLSNLY